MNELEAFDELPSELRETINYSDIRFDARAILGMYKQQGIRDTKEYLEFIQENFVSGKEFHAS